MLLTRRLTRKFKTTWMRCLFVPKRIQTIMIPWNSVNKIIHSFSLIQNRHKTAQALKIEAANNELKIINDEFTALIAQELLKKEGKASNKS